MQGDDLTGQRYASWMASCCLVRGSVPGPREGREAGGERDALGECDLFTG